MEVYQSAQTPAARTTGGVVGTSRGDRPATTLRRDAGENDEEKQTHTLANSNDEDSTTPQDLEESRGEELDSCYHRSMRLLFGGPTKYLTIFTLWSIVSGIILICLGTTALSENPTNYVLIGGLLVIVPIFGLLSFFILRDLAYSPERSSGPHPRPFLKGESINTNFSRNVSVGWLTLC